MKHGFVPLIRNKGSFTEGRGNMEGRKGEREKRKEGRKEGGEHVFECMLIVARERFLHGVNCPDLVGITFVAGLRYEAFKKWRQLGGEVKVFERQSLEGPPVGTKDLVARRQIAIRPDSP